MMFPVLLALPLLSWPYASGEGPDARAVDIFGRSLHERGLTLVDWEGTIANPAVQFFVIPPPDARYPVQWVIRSKEPRLSFDLPSEAGPDGPSKQVRLDRPEKAPISLAIFPDRDGHDERHSLEIELSDADDRRRVFTLPIHVIDQDRDRPASFPITVDFAQDRTGFFADEARRAVVIRAAEDWADFFDGDGLDPVPADAETTLIWDPDGFQSTRRVTNERAYTGYLLYAYGIDGPELRSGGEPSRLGGFQAVRGEPLPIRRSGGYEAEIKGNYNRLGWLAGLADAEWWKATNLRDVETDLDSIAHHEIGHALIFNPANTRFGAAKRLGRLRDDRVRAYLGHDPTIDRADHLAGSIDPASLRGAFGNEYHGKMPYGRWLITKLDLLCAQAVGYRLRETSAFAQLVLAPGPLPDGAVSKPYTAALKAEGGIPAYHWEIIEGTLPAGLALDSFTGGVTGTPRKPGDFAITVRVRDQHDTGQGARQTMRIKVAAR